MLKGLELNGFSQFEFDTNTSLKMCAYKLFVFLRGGGEKGKLVVCYRGGRNGEHCTV